MKSVRQVSSWLWRIFWVVVVFQGSARTCAFLGGSPPSSFRSVRVLPPTGFPPRAVSIPAQDSLINGSSDGAPTDTGNGQQEESPAGTHIRKSSPLSLTLEELAQVMGGRGRAQACWDCFRLGVDPLWFYAVDDTEEATEPLEFPLLEALANCGDKETLSSGWTRAQIQAHISPRRQTQGLGRNSLKRLKDAFSEANSQSAVPEKLEADSLNSIAKVVQVHTSKDGTTKLLLQLTKDLLQVEAVIIPWPDRQSSTLCVSNQVGCKQGCTFCSTGRMGELRSLTADEILVQVYWAAKACRLMPQAYPLDAIVFMGMGEAARNVEPVVRSATNLVDPQLFQLAPRRVTISTVGPSPESFQQLGRAPVVLAWSIHASQNSVRKQLVPTTKYSMEELRDGLIQTLLQRPKKLRQIMLEIAMIDNINDRAEDARHLVDFCQAFYDEVPGVKVVVNLIPWNDIQATSGPAANYKKPRKERILAFQNILINKNILCYIRTTRGDDESAACGQLATKASPRGSS